MSDIRFIMIGVVVVSVGFIILGFFGSDFTQITVETGEFSTCYEYSDDKTPIEIKCDEALQDKTLLFLGVTTIIGIGIFSLVKGVKGTWDQDVKPEEMLGPGGDKKDSSSNDDK